MKLLYADWQFKIQILICTTDISFVRYRLRTLAHWHTSVLFVIQLVNLCLPPDSRVKAKVGELSQMGVCQLVEMCRNLQHNVDKDLFTGGCRSCSDADTGAADTDRLSRQLSSASLGNVKIDSNYKEAYHTLLTCN